MKSQALLIILYFLLISSAVSQNVWQTLKEEEVTTWAKNIVEALPNHYNTIKITDLDFIPSASGFLNYGVKDIQIVFPKTVHSHAFFLNKQESIKLDITFPTLTVKVNLANIVTLEFEIQKLVLRFESKSFEGRIHMNQVLFKYEKIDITNSIIKKFVPESMLNNDQIKQYVKDASVYIRRFFNIGIRDNRELLQKWVYTGRVFREIDEQFVYDNIGNIQHFQVNDKTIVLSLSKIFRNQSIIYNQGGNDQKQKKDKSDL